MEYITGWKRLERIVNKKEMLSASQVQQLEQITSQLLAHRPVQYILHEAWFHGIKMYVDENVLIPRPETEELVEWAIGVVDGWQKTIDRKKLRVLDVGTGSGCIPIALKKERPALEVYACDISDGALTVARKNATLQNVEIEFKRLDFLNEESRSALPFFDVIISNPPYISTIEKSSIDKHVIEYEPHLALFVPENDSLIFYRHLADFAKTHLAEEGNMLMEIHYEKGIDVKRVLNERGFASEIKKDMNGNDRMVRAWKVN
jgi:release factor glutamine methyltransferase